MKRRWLAPEVIQSSATDCGPAAVKSALGGFGVPVSYGRLREACQTGVDGTSIDTLEELLLQLGMRAEQVLLPADHMEVPEAGALPAIAVARLPHGDTHFVVLWRRHGPLVQVMDPAAGRRYLSWRRLREELYQHEAEVPAEAYREWAVSPEGRAVLGARLRGLGIDPAPLLDAAAAGPGLALLCHLDAAARVVSGLVAARVLSRGAAAGQLLRALLGDVAAGRELPAEAYAARPLSESGAEGARVRLRGAVLVRIAGRADHLPALRSALDEVPPRPLRDLFALLGAARWRSLAWLGLGALLLGLLVTAQAFVLRALLELVPRLRLWTQRLLFGGAAAGLAAAALILRGALHAHARRLGRIIEVRLRLSILHRLPRLPDAYLRSRPLSDLAERCHRLHRAGEVPLLLLAVLRAAAQVLFTAAALCWLDPAGAPLVAALVGGTVGLPLLLLPWVQERDLRLRTHQGALGRFFLDGLLGLVAVRAHGAEGTLLREQEGLLCEWARARGALARAVLALVGGQSLLGLGLVGLLWLGYLQRSHEIGGGLLLVYWSLSIPLLGQALVLGVRQYPALRSTVLRLLEPLSAPADAQGEEDGADEDPGADPTGAAAVRLSGVELALSGRPVLRGVDLALSPGEHVAVVGPSGAGKSSLAGLLLGWHHPATGQVLVDGRPLTPARLARLRRQMVWVDPEVHLWNAALLDNLCYGADGPPADLTPVLAQAELLPLLARLPAGLGTPLGEGGALVSGGEGQRVRLGRGLLRQGPRLVVLDEPLRGLEHARRLELLARARARFADATLLCITHDVRDTLGFPRVLVIDEGRVAEDGEPMVLAQRPGSRYRDLLQAEVRARGELWEHPAWRRLRLQGGVLKEDP